MRRPSLVLLIICSLTYSASAQEKFRVVHWDLEDGLSQGEVYQMLKDKNGFLWVGTSGGLCRFDGSRFRKYYHDPQKPGTFNATVSGFGLVEDSLHNIWIGTNNGLARYDFQADTFAHFFSDVGKPYERYTFPFWATADQVFAFESDTAIVSYDIRTPVRKRITGFLPTDSVTGSSSALSSCFVDQRTNSIWVLKGYTGSYGGSPGGGLIQIDMTTGQKKVYEWKCFKNIPRHHHGAERMVFDRKRNCLWLNSWEGLMQFTLIDNQFHYVGALNPFFADKDYGHWVGISIDNQNRIWVAANPKGIVIYDPSDHSVKFPFPNDEKLQKDISDFNACIYHDNEGITWSGYWLRKGINQLLPFSPAFKHYQADGNNPYALGTPNVINTVPAGKGKVWIGSFYGLHLFDTRTERFTAFQKKDLPDLKGDVQIPFAADTSDSDLVYVMVPRAGLYSVAVSKKLVQPLVFKDSSNHKIEIDQAKVFSYYGSFDNGFLFSAYREDQECVFKIEFGSSEAVQVFKLPIKAELRKSEFMSEDGLLFLRGQSGYSNLTYRVSTDNKWELIHSPLDSISWSVAISNKMDQGIWVVVGKQLIHYDKGFRMVRSYSPAEGLPDVDIYSAIADEQGNIWFNTDRSIHVLNVETGIISTLSEKDGFEHQSYTNGPGLALGPGGDIYLGGGIFGVGLTRITPKKFTYTPASVYFQNLTINDEALPLSTGANSLQELSLGHAQNQIAIETGIIDYYSRGKSHLRFQLKGFNDSWQYEPAYYTIRYDGLPPGEYTLLMQGSNAANQFVGPVKSLRILISPPWWNTWWAYVLFAGTIASAIWALVQYRSRSLKQSNLALEQKVAERTNDLEKSLVDLRETQVQLIQSEKMASLGELTAGIAHEIQNPLNFVNNFSEVSNELLDEMKSELAQDHKEGAITIANDVKQNLEKILHHGKRADAIVKGMLQHSRTSSGAKEPTDINTLIDEYLRLSYHGLRAKDKAFNAAMKTDFDPTLGTVNIVPQDMGRVVLNIINNAFYAVTEKKRRKADDPLKYEPLVTVRTKRLGDKVLISISDNGDGIPEKVLDKIFQPFFTTKPTGQGTGLGLSLSYDIVKAHGGEIRIQTKEGVGSEFSIEIPL